MPGCNTSRHPFIFIILLIGILLLQSICYAFDESDVHNMIDAIRSASSGNRMRSNRGSAEEQPQASFVTMTDGDLAKAVAAIQEKSSGAVFVKKRDGFEVNGKRYIDSEGQIVSYSYNAQNGDVTYIAELSDNSYVLKYTRVSWEGEPLTIASADYNGAKWSITTVTKKKLTGERLLPLSCGFIVVRDAAAFQYVPGKKIQNIAAPDGFAVATFQNGDVLQTRYLLLEKINENQHGSVGSAVESVKSLGSVLGLTKKEDYMLLNIDTDEKITLNVDYDGKQVANYSNCKPGRLVNKCREINFHASLYDRNGGPNYSHYYWRINWFNTESGPVVIYKENSTKEVTAQNLKTGKKARLFYRMLGIHSFDAKQGTDGKISVTAQLGFSKDKVDDVEAFLNSAKEEVASK